MQSRDLKARYGTLITGHKNVSVRTHEDGTHFISNTIKGHAKGTGWERAEEGCRERDISSAP